MKRAWKRLIIGGLLGALIVPTTAQSAQADPVTRGYKCEGERVVRCISLHWDDANRRFRVHADILDVQTDNYNYDVAIHYTVVHGNGTYPDGDGWWQVAEHAQSGLIICWPGTPARYKDFSAAVTWRPVGGTPVERSITSRALVCD